MNKKIISVMSVALVVFLCTSFPVFADVYPGSSITNNFSFDLDGSNYNNLKCTVRTTSFLAEEGSYVIAANNSSGMPIYGQLDKYTVLVRVNLINDSTEDIQLGVSNFSLKFIPTNTSDYNNGQLLLYNAEYKEGLLIPTFVSSNGEVNIAVASDSDYVTWIVIPARSQICSIFELHYEYKDVNANNYSKTPPNFGTTGITWYYPSLPITWANVQDIRTDNFGYIQLLYQKFKEFLSSYNSNAPASQDVTSDASSSSSVIDSQHQQESNIYSQTNQAIGNTGINNFQFDSQTIGGLGGVKNDFMAVWNALGSFNSIFITSLTIGLALSIVRHRRMFKQ